MKTIRLTSAADLKARFKKIKPFMSTQLTRNYLCGAYFEYKNNNLRATATNGHILCTMEWDLGESEDGVIVEPFSLICPASAINNLIKIITAKNSNDGAVLINVSDNDTVIEFDFGDYKYNCRVVDGNFPDYTKVLPKGEQVLKEGLNAGYLTSVLNALGNSAVDILVDDGGEANIQPHLFSSKDCDGVQCVIMPIIRA